MSGGSLIQRSHRRRILAALQLSTNREDEQPVHSAVQGWDLSDLAEGRIGLSLCTEVFSIRTSLCDKRIIQKRKSIRRVR